MLSTRCCRTSSVVYSISRRILKHEHAQKTPASPRTTAKPFGWPTRRKRKASPPWHAATKSAASPFTAPLKAARAKLLKPQTSTNNRFKQAKYGMKRLAKVERAFRKNSKSRPNATINPTPESRYISIPNGCRCSKAESHR